MKSLCAYTISSNSNSWPRRYEVYIPFPLEFANSKYCVVDSQTNSNFEIWLAGRSFANHLTATNIVSAEMHTVYYNEVSNYAHLMKKLSSQQLNRIQVEHNDGQFNNSSLPAIGTKSYSTFKKDHNTRPLCSSFNYFV